MAEGQVRQRLAAVLAADVAGYSRLMGDDERATIATLENHRDIFRSTVEANGGRVVDMAGDSVLAIFDTASGAVRAAIHAQAELRLHNEGVPEGRRMEFRVGVNSGDIQEKSDGTVYGDGVNVAARLEGLADPGGVIVSSTVHGAVAGRIDAAFVDTGEHDVKNIARPVRAYRVVFGDDKEMAPASSASRAPDKPSIAVLAFENLSRDPDQEYFADGITEDIITELSRLRWLTVSARNSSFTYKGAPVDVKRVGRELNVRYVVEGSVRRGGDRVRITAQLIDAETGNHIWAERYDRELTDIFALQDEITETLLGALQVEVGEFERVRANRKPPDSLDAWEFYQRGMWHLYRMSADEHVKAADYFARSVKEDPNFAQGLAACAYIIFLDIFLLRKEKPSEALAEGLRLAERAVALDQKDMMGHFVLGRLHSLSGNHKAAISELETAIELNPGSALAHYGLGGALVMAERPEEGIPEFGTAIRLSPRDPALWAFYGYRGWALLAMGEYEASILDSQRAVTDPAAAAWPFANLASALALVGHEQDARNALNKLFQVAPDFSFEKAMQALSPLDPKAPIPGYERWLEGLRQARLSIPAQPD